MVEFGVEELTLLDFAFALKEKYGIVLDLSKYSDELLTRPKLPFLGYNKRVQETWFV